MPGYDRAIGEAYATIVNRQRWDWFVTLTFRPEHGSATGGVHPEKADKAWRVFVSRVNRAVYGVRWFRSLQSQCVWVRGQEFHKSGRIHFHGLMAGTDRDLNLCYRRLDAMDWWYQEFGIARIEAPQSHNDVSAYVSKYAAKAGEVDFSPNFGKVEVDPLNLGFYGNRVPGHKDPDQPKTLCARVGDEDRKSRKNCLSVA